MPASVKLVRAVEENFSTRLDVAFANVFSLELTTEWSLMTMQRTSRLTSGKRLTMQHKRFIQGFAEGYYESLQQIKNG